MANTTLRGHMIFNDENALAHVKKVVVAAGKGKTSLAAPKKHGAGFASRRKALNDITNKSKLKPQASSKTNKNVAEGADFDIAKEGFLHDHRKCVEEQEKNQWDCYFSDHINLHGHDSTIKDETKDEEDKSSNSWYEVKEIPIEEEYSDLLVCSTQWLSPPDSPIRDHSSLPSSPLPWHFETVEFKLKEDEDSA
ncbi:unnamed protein product [Cochlearia groenlandica]